MSTQGEESERERDLSLTHMGQSPKVVAKIRLDVTVTALMDTVSH
jgi:hypothetical protein